MNLRDQPEVCGFTIFCDDIRQELGGKISLIGCYSGTIFIHTEFPFTFPKFCFAITLMQRREHLDPNIEIRIVLPGDSIDAPSLVASSRETREGAVAEETAKAVEGLPVFDQRTVAMHVNLIAAPLVIKEPGIIQVRAVRRGELVRLGGIRVVAAPAPATDEPLIEDDLEF
jgi:hypothetical protein